MAAPNIDTRIKWTVIPDSRSHAPATGVIRFSALVSPELLATTAGDIGTFVSLASSPFSDWAQTLTGLSFKAHFGSGLELQANTRTQADTSLWQRFFSAVNARLRDISAEPNLTPVARLLDDRNRYPYSEAHQHLMLAYQGACTDSLQSLADFVRGGPLPATQSTAPPLPVARAMKERFGTPVAPVRTGGQAHALKQAVAFYDRKLNLPDPQGSKDPQFDFHEWVSLLANYPWLQRRLGLLLDFELPFVANAFPPGDDFIWLTATPGFATGPFLRTHFTFTANPPKFEARYADPSLLPFGCLPLGDSTLYSLSQVSVDGAALRAESFGRELDAMTHEKLDDYAVPPALHGGPLTVARNDLAVDLGKKIDRAKHLQSTLRQNNDVDLYAEDLIKGFRVDIFFRDRWFPLCRRTCALQLNAGGAQSGATETDEGWLTIAPTQQHQEYYLHEAMFGWAGWNLVAPKPGRTLGKDGTAIT